MRNAHAFTLGSFLLCAMASVSGGCRRAPAPTGSAAIGSKDATDASPLAATGAPSLSVAGDAEVADASSLAWLTKPDFGPRGPIRVAGYSRTVGTGMNDPAHVVGFTKDSREFGYCSAFGGRDPQSTMCEFVDRDGKERTLGDDDAKGNYAPKKHAEIVAWLKDAGVPELGKKGSTLVAPKLEGEWDFARDVELDLVEHAQGKKGAMVRLGGRVRSEPAVYPVNLDMDPGGRGAAPFHTSWVNGLVVSPDGMDLGLVAGFFCMEWCDAFVVRRWKLAQLASLVYNDTAMRHHTKGEYQASAALFVEAVWANPANDLAAYNLACAFARLGDGRASAALAHAIRIGGEAVRLRATQDADFATVHDSPWFKATTKAP